MKDNRVGKRIGFMLASIHNGSSLKLWSHLAVHESQEKGSFFIFPGGRLDSQPGSENLRNSIFSLVNADNLDGVISWASSIGGTVSIEELSRFHTSLEPLPLVTIGQKVADHPMVAFDAYSGQKELVKHFISVHGYKRIAFLRGPANHTSAEDRYRAYIDAMNEAGLFSIETQKLVTDPFGWSDGEYAVQQLYEDRGLVPGRDFDALIASSDMMAFSAANWLQKRGFRIPKDIAVGGFNDSVESHIGTCSFSTVHMPHEEIGLEADRLINEVLQGASKVADRLLPSYIVIRDSCGCNNLKSWIASPESRVHAKTRQQLVEEFSQLFRLTKLDCEKVIEPMIEALFENNLSEFYTILNKWLLFYFHEDGDVSLIFSGISILRGSNCLPVEYIEKILRTVTILIPQALGQVSSFKRYESQKTASALNALKCDLLSVHDRPTLMAKLARYLPQIGIYNAAIILYENDDFSRYAGGFNSFGIMPEEQECFPAKQLVPVKHKAEFTIGVFVVQPLFMENQPLGYFIAGYSGCEGIIYEDLRSTISGALQSIFLFEETNAAKKIAEQAEFAKTEFFANVGSDLCDPLRNISAKLDQMEINIESGILDQDILSEQLLFLKSQIDSQLEKTETLVELTRSQVDDLPMNKRLYRIFTVLPESAVSKDFDEEFPLLYGDSERLKKAFEIIWEKGCTTFSVTAESTGVQIYFESSNIDWLSPEMQLAEKIVLLQYGEIFKDGFSCTILLPWPNLACLPPLKTDTSLHQIYSLSPDTKRQSLFHIPVEEMNDAAVFNQTTTHTAGLLLWEPDAAPIDEWIKVYSLRHHEKLFRTPLLCYSHTIDGESFMSVLEQKVRTQKKAPVLFINAAHTHYGTWATDENSVSINSIEEFDHIVDEITPALIVFETIDEISIKKIRQSAKTVLVPILVLPDTIESDVAVDLLCAHPRIILCNRGAAESEQFDTRIRAILSGDEILPPHTGALVKKAILYLNRNAPQQIVRWKLADTVHVSEDYLTRIFHKEIGLSLWEYLNRYRIYLATKMLLETNDTIYEIAEKSGFQDQAYFCRVFKKIYGVPPGKIRTK
jgi:DNA-binding LacI/PurR family transcriptional regulator/AraC-like DNA-binding protein